MRIPSLAVALCAALLAVPAAASADTFSNTSGITIADNQPASPYPSGITVSGLTGVITDLEVRVTGLTHSLSSDIDMLLRAPSGASVMLMSDSCGVGNLRFTDGGPALGSGGCTSGTYRPTDASPGDSLPAAGGLPTETRLAAFRGGDPNGVWELFVADDAGADVGSISGWSITITTGAGLITIPASGTSGVASTYPLEIAGPASSPGFVIEDLSITLVGLHHTKPEDLDILLQGPTGVSVPLAADVCGSADLFDGDLTFSDTAASILGGGPCTEGTFRPSSPTPGDLWASPAPAPTGSTLAAFHRTDPRGTWRVYIEDDAASGSGSTGSPALSVTTVAARPLFFFSDAVPAIEGATATVRVARLGAPSGPATVDYVTVPGTAAEGADFTPASGRLSFAAGELTKRIQVPIISDGTAEDTEHLTVRLSNATGDAAIDGSDEARVVIAASEGPATPPATPEPRTPAAPCDAFTGAAKAGCLRRQRAATARAACLKRYPKAGARRAACLRAAAKLALPPGRR